jgi:DNA mismatch repair protein MutL
LIPSHQERGEGDTTLRIIGQFGGAFIVCEGEDGKLVVIDQHAAHERLGFERLKEQLGKGRVEEQRLLLPERLDFSPKEKAVIMEHIKSIETAGFEIEDFGKNTIVIKAVPAILGDVSLKNIFEKMAAELADFGSSGTLEGEIDRIFSVIACHAQVRAGDTLSFEEMRQLVRDIERTNISHCPHGRPATIEIDRSEVEKWFKRT